MQLPLLLLLLLMLQLQLRLQLQLHWFAVETNVKLQKKTTASRKF